MGSATKPQGFLAEGWQRLNDRTIGSARYWSIALQNRSFYLDMAPLIARYVGGDVLDLGAGRLAWRTTLRPFARSYTSADLVRCHDELDHLVDLTQTLPFADHSYDTVFCCSVLEHLFDYERAMAEMARILRPGGRLVLSLPFLFYRHGDPDDYFRFSPYAIRRLAERHGLAVTVLHPQGGVIEGPLNLASMALSALLLRLGLSGLIPAVTWTLCTLARALDLRADPERRFAQNHIAVLEPKPPCASS